MLEPEQPRLKSPTSLLENPPPTFDGFLPRGSPFIKDNAFSDEYDDELDIVFERFVRATRKNNDFF